MRARVLLVLLCFAVGQPIAFAIGWLQAPDVPASLHVVLGLLVGTVLAFVLDRMRHSQLEAFAAARRGHLAHARAVLARRRSGDALARVDEFGTAALEVALAEPPAALARVAADPSSRFGPGATQRLCVERHLELSSPDAGVRARALEPLLGTKPQRLEEAERYRAYLIARAALEPHGAELIARAAALLAKARDPVARAYAQWVRAWHDLPIDESDRLADARRAVELARDHHGMTVLAARVDARASAIERAAAAVGPYRR